MVGIEAVQQLIFVVRQNRLRHECRKWTVPVE